MRPNLSIFVATLATFPIAAIAQTYGGTGQQRPPPQISPQQDEQLKPAKAADIKAGASVSDQKGGSVGKVDSVDAEGAVISTGSVRAKVPLSSLAIGSKGLVLSVTKDELEAAAKKKAEKSQ